MGRADPEDAFLSFYDTAHKIFDQALAGRVRAPVSILEAIETRTGGRHPDRTVRILIEGTAQIARHSVCSAMGGPFAIVELNRSPGRCGPYVTVARAHDRSVAST